jgi:hypothetical protein
MVKEGVNDFRKKANFTTLLDNERKWILTESANISYDVSKV